MFKCVDILLISEGEKVGVIFLQQLPHVKQSVSGQIVLSMSVTIWFNFFGGAFSTLVRNIENDLLYRLTFCPNERRLIASINYFILNIVN